MLTSISDENNRKVDEVVDSILNEMVGDIMSEKPESKAEFFLTLKSVLLSEDKPEIKFYLKEFLKELEKFGIPFLDEEFYDDKSKSRAPIFWSNQADDYKLVRNQEYNLKAKHYRYDDNRSLGELWLILERTIACAGKLNIDGTYCQDLFKKCGNSVYTRRTDDRLEMEVPLKSTPYDKLLSEVWVETMPIKDITNGELRIEFGQNINGRKANEVFFATDAIMAVSELPILLDRIAQYNIENPGNEIYLKNTGVSIDEINSGKFKTLDERYGKDENGEIKNNEGANLIIVEGVRRQKNSRTLREHTKTVLSLRYLILKREKQRLKKCIKRLEEEKNKEKTPEDLEKEKSNTQHNISDNENKQHNFIEKARQKQEIDYLIEKDLKQKNFSTDEEKESFIKERKKELKEIFKSLINDKKKYGKHFVSLIDKKEKEEFTKWTAKHQKELEEKEEKKVKSLQDKIKEIRERGEQNMDKPQTQLVLEREEESKNQASEIMA